MLMVEFYTFLFSMSRVGKINNCGCLLHQLMSGEEILKKQKDLNNIILM